MEWSETDPDRRWECTVAGRVVGAVALIVIRGGKHRWWMAYTGDREIGNEFDSAEDAMAAIEDVPIAGCDADPLPGETDHVAWYRVRLRIVPAKPLTNDQVNMLNQAGVDVWRRSGELSVTLTVDGGDPAGALARAQNVVLDQVSGGIEHAEVTLAEAPERQKGRRSRER